MNRDREIKALRRQAAHFSSICNFVPKSVLSFAEIQNNINWQYAYNIASVARYQNGETDWLCPLALNGSFQSFTLLLSEMKCLCWIPCEFSFIVLISSEGERLTFTASEFQAMLQTLPAKQIWVPTGNKQGGKRKLSYWLLPSVKLNRETKMRLVPDV